MPTILALAVTADIRVDTYLPFVDEARLGRRPTRPYTSHLPPWVARSFGRDPDRQ